MTGSTGAPQIQTRGGNVQVNDPSLDSIQILSNLFPLVMFTQSETSVAAFGNSIVATYNSSANQQYSPAGQFLHALNCGACGTSSIASCSRYLRAGGSERRAAVVAHTWP